ncbi:phosphoethanolamine--lipid A transferase [Massilia sp. IC2-278]|uniref:phosphoethanolamine transferase n=1 Tax=Massilia sp. IC2-278 TaxID=2887200 RepID=UPI001E5684EB|nr:phosphoethanolamine--lipid A transferase [Massilia sp. IC2-278]MCC2963482.1 phosphoethanolamine--lipid A transferase [Massilia sp. IC2-278]
MDKLLARRISAPYLTLAVAVFLATAGNIKFWTTFAAAAGGLTPAHLPLLAGAMLIIVLFFNACLTLASFRFVAKPVFIVLLVTASTASYFIAAYGIVIDRAMVQNVFETDVREASELVSWHMLLTIGLLGLLPASWIARARIAYPQGRRGLMLRGAIAGGSLLLAFLLLVMLFKSLAPTVREHRELRFLLTPTNTIQAMNGYLRSKWSTPIVVAPLGRDAMKGKTWAGQARKTVTVIVVGETARAMNFSLNGYRRETNPLLAREPGLINFSNVSACGTATAVSVPCVFSALGREEYAESKASSQEGLLDVLQHAGLKVVWRDNNSGCKGVCARVAYQDLSQALAGDPFCEGEERHDERLLAGLPELIRNSDRDLVVVLHQKGSHGPAYARRYPQGFGRFAPVCTTNEFEKCSRAEIENAYDNTILYTDYFLSKTIGLLRQTAAQEGMDTAMLYFSDHGESLGENNLYLHGAPYMFAPAEQTRVPMMLWMSDGFSERFGIDRTCLMARRGQPLSHDNVFHSVLGMLDVNTAVLNPRLDLFHACRRGA